MIQYFENKDLAEIDGYKFRRDKKTGYYLSAKPIGETRKRLHVYVWEKENGAVPKGYHIHHVDGDKYNNELDNLALIEGKAHIKYHGRHLTEEEKENRRANLAKNALPKAAEWHKSEEGREWHKTHGKETWVNRKPVTYTCTQCGAKFESLNIYPDGSNTFCSNKCKAAFRRDSGVDDIDKVCKYCGKVYRANKYQGSTCCEDCKRSGVWRRRRV